MPVETLTQKQKEKLDILAGQTVALGILPATPFGKQLRDLDRSHYLRVYGLANYQTMYVVLRNDGLVMARELVK